MRLKLSKNQEIDFRVSTLPTQFGEKVVIRILDGSGAALGLEVLGLESEQFQLYEEAIKRPYGMILVTGPTGSGKTVSLYTALNILNTGIFPKSILPLKLLNSFRKICRLLIKRPRVSFR